jgi:DNA-binding FadR family transcriptional regulator
MMRLGSLLDWWGPSYHTSERNVIEAALQYAGERGRTEQELVTNTEFAQHQVRHALRTLQKKGRVEMAGDRYRVRGPKGK